MIDVIECALTGYNLFILVGIASLIETNIVSKNGIKQNKLKGFTSGYQPVNDDSGLHHYCCQNLKVQA